MPKDIRVPTSTTVVKGKYIVRVYDEAAYAANIAQYHQEGQGKVSNESDKQKPPKPYTPFPKRSYANWYGNRIKTAS